MPIDIIDAVAPLRARLASPRRDGTTVGLVPTMGALHAGHAGLIEEARRDCGCVVVSIFVNPIQFDRQEDLARYPRSLSADAALCASLGVDVLFAPGMEEMYPEPLVCLVDVGRIADHLCGRYRPGHFKGVATVVMKLLQIVQPDVAYFGEKDAQQLAVVRRMVSDLNVPTRIAAVATVREPDGLALSSRNQRLDPAERQMATALYRALHDAQAQIASGERDVEAIKRRAAGQIPAHANLRLEYLEVVEPQEFQPVHRVDGPVVIAGALWIGTTRLIDNLSVTPG